MNLEKQKADARARVKVFVEKLKGDLPDYQELDLINVTLLALTLTPNDEATRLFIDDCVALCMLAAMENKKETEEVFFSN